MSTKTGRFDIDWWVIQKRMIHLIAFLTFAILLAGAGGVYIWLYGNPFSRFETVASGAAGARFISYEGDVRVIRSSSRETVNATTQIQLYPGDTVQTQADGRARISLADGSTLVVRPNSTVIIRDNTTSENGRPSTVRVQVGSGQINLRTEQQTEGTKSVIETPQTKNQVGSQTGASFGVDPNDHNEEIRVTSGEIETTSNNGEKAVIRGGEYVAVNATGTLSRQKLLDIPQPISPHDLEKVSAGSGGTAGVTLKWQRPASGLAAHYRVEVATSPFFVPSGKLIERDQLASNEFSVSDLRTGSYFWRIRATASTGQVSDWSDPQKFVVVPGGEGNRISMNIATPEYIGGSVYIVRGKTDAGTTVSCLGRETLAAADGTFQLQIAAPTGVNEVVLEALDSQGNKNQYKVALVRSRK